MYRTLPSLRSRLAILVLLPLLPALVFLGGLLVREFRQDELDTQRSAALAARALAVAIDQRLLTAEAALRGLSGSSALAEGRLGEFHAEAAAVARATGMANILLVGPSGEHLLNTLRPWGTPLPLVQLDEGWQRVFRGQGVVARIAPPVLRGRPVVVVALPVVRAGAVRWGLGAVLPAEAFQSLVDTAAIPQPWVVAVLDPDQRVVARSSDAARYLGQPATPQLRAAMAATAGTGEGWVDAVTLDGRRTRASFARGSSHGWAVVVGVPEGTVGPPLAHSLALLGGAGLLIVGAALAADLWIARRLGRDVQALVQQSDQVGSGDPRVRARLHFAEGERIAGALGQAGARLVRARETLERRNEDLQEFAYAAAHDLRAPLRTVRSLLDVLGERHAAALGPEGTELLGRASRAVDRVHRMTRDLLAFARVEHRDASFGPVDLSRAAAEAVAALQGEAEAAGAVLEVEPLPTVHGDPAQLHVLLQNLLANALRFRGEAPCRVRVGAARDDGGGWRIWVMDNGIGIAPEHREQVFGLFKRLGHGSPVAGTGIGLALCRRIVEHHGGRIWVVSRPGQGSTFFFTLPAGDDHAAAPAV